jgi:hypothetical protein
LIANPSVVQVQVPDQRPHRDRWIAPCTDGALFRSVAVAFMAIDRPRGAAMRELPCLVFGSVPTSSARSLTMVVFLRVRARYSGMAWPQRFVIQSRGVSNMNQFIKYVSALFLAVTLMSAVGCAATSKQEGTGEYVDDSVITAKVKAAILNEATLKVAEINVETFKGVVQLSGFVGTQADIDKAIAVARAVGGVKSVKNDMRLK